MLRRNQNFNGWNDDYRVGHEVLDAQRDALVGLFHETLDALGDSGRIEHARECFARLLGSIRDYFAEEERILRDVGYPDLQRHLMEHKVLMVEAETFHRCLNNGLNLVTSRSTVLFLWNLVIGHLTLSDIELRGHLPHCGGEPDEPLGLNNNTG